MRFAKEKNIHQDRGRSWVAAGVAAGAGCNPGALAAANSHWPSNPAWWRPTW